MGPQSFGGARRAAVVVIAHLFSYFEDESNDFQVREAARSLHCILPDNCLQ